MLGMKCPKCGKENRTPDAVYCINCGQALNQPYDARPDTESRQNFIVLGIMIVAAFVLIWYGVSHQSNPPQPPTDKELFKTFYTLSMRKTEKVDEIFKPITIAASSGNIQLMVQECAKALAPLNASITEFEMLAVPDLKNKEAKADLIASKKMFVDAYKIRLDLATNVAMMIKNPSSTKRRMKNMENMAYDFQAKIMIGAMGYLSAGQKLGLAPDEIEKIQ